MLLNSSPYRSQFTFPELFEHSWLEHASSWQVFMLQVLMPPQSLSAPVVQAVVENEQPLLLQAIPPHAGLVPHFPANDLQALREQRLLPEQLIRKIQVTSSTHDSLEPPRILTSESSI
jgi:hypothetical protein